MADSSAITRKAKELAAMALELGSPVAGAIAGGLAGTGLGPMGTAGGAALGYAGGKELSDLGKHYLFGEELPSNTPKDQAIRVASNLAEAGAMELAGPVLAKGAGALGRRLIALGEVGSVGKKIPLDMSDPARLARAEKMGYDTERVFNHGSLKPQIEEFSLDRAHGNFGQKAGPGIYTTPDENYAKQYTQNISGETVGRVHKLVLPKDVQVLDYYSNPGALAEFVKKNELGEVGRFDSDPAWAVWSKVKRKFKDLPETEQFSKMKSLLRESGYAGIAREGDAGKEFVISSPELFRDLEKAKFDPAKKKSGNILAGIAAAISLTKSKEDK